MNAIPPIPSSAPFTQAQRFWLDGYLAALFAGAVEAVESGPAKERVLILYASQSGNSESLAESFGEKLSAAGFEAPVICTEDFSSTDLAGEKKLLIVTSTWGDGDPPDNAVEFWESLSADDHPRLEELQFSVLGLGDSNYLDFCGMGKKFDARLEALGAKRFSPRGDCDVDFEETANAWLDATLKSLGSESPETATEEKPATAFSKKNPFPARLKANRKLNAEGSERDTRHFEIDLSGSGLTYEVGDVLGVLPENDPELVDELLGLLRLDPGAQTGEGVPLRDALLTGYDIQTINPRIIEAWETFSGPVALGEEERAAYCSDHHLIDLAIDHPAKFESADDLVGLLRKLAPRLYSISSSPKAHPGEVHLTVAKVTYEMHGRPRIGVCSTYLADRAGEDGTVKVFLQAVKHFKLPGDPSTPVIMVGPGTGIAPFRAFLEERAVTSSPGENWLFFGNPHEATDWFYREEFEALQEQGILTRLDTAWSRDQETKIYVQDRIRENAAELWTWLNERGAHVYVCGDAKRMAKDVDDALHQLISDQGGLTTEEAAGYVNRMKKEKRYQRDVY